MPVRRDGHARQVRVGWQPPKKESATEAHETRRSGSVRRNLLSRHFGPHDRIAATLAWQVRSPPPCPARASVALVLVTIARTRCRAGVHLASNMHGGQTLTLANFQDGRACILPWLANTDQNCIEIFRCKSALVICISTMGVLDWLTTSRATPPTALKDLFQSEPYLSQVERDTRHVAPHGQSNSSAGVVDPISSEHCQQPSSDD